MREGSAGSGHVGETVSGAQAAKIEGREHEGYGLGVSTPASPRKKKRCGLRADSRNMACHDVVWYTSDLGSPPIDLSRLDAMTPRP